MSSIKTHRSLRGSESSSGQNEDHGEMRDVQVEGTGFLYAGPNARHVGFRVAVSITFTLRTISLFHLPRVGNCMVQELMARVQD